MDPITLGIIFALASGTIGGGIWLAKESAKEVSIEALQETERMIARQRQETEKSLYRIFGWFSLFISSWVVTPTIRSISRGNAGLLEIFWATLLITGSLVLLIRSSLKKKQIAQVIPINMAKKSDVNSKMQDLKKAS